MAQDNLEIIIKQSGLEETKSNFLLENFKNYFEIAAEWELKAKSIIVNNENQKAEMDMARVGRLFLGEKRRAIEKSRKSLKEQSLREGKAIDGIANVLKSLIEPIEEYLDKQEHFVEIKQKEEQEILRIENEKKLEEERILKEKSEKEEQERIRIENEKLRKDADENEKNRIAREKEIQVEIAKVEAEKKAIEDKARKEKEEADKKRLSEIAKAEAEKKDLLEKQKKLEEELSKQIECPHCHKKFVLK